jgi:hypothetical protein
MSAHLGDKKEKIMSRQGMKAAMEHGLGLPEFPSLREAERSLLALREKKIQELISRSQEDPTVKLDFSVESLLRLERWYFSSSHPKNEIAQGCAFYFGEVVVRNKPGAKWVVQEFVFTKGRYEIGVQDGHCTMNLFSFRSKLEHPDNTKRDSLWRTYQHYFARNPNVTIQF